MNAAISMLVHQVFIFIKLLAIAPFTCRAFCGALVLIPTPLAAWMMNESFCVVGFPFVTPRGSRRKILFPLMFVFSPKDMDRFPVTWLFSPHMIELYCPFILFSVPPTIEEPNDCVISFLDHHIIDDIKVLSIMFSDPHPINHSCPAFLFQYPHAMVPQPILPLGIMFFSQPQMNEKFVFILFSRPHPIVDHSISGKPNRCSIVFHDHPHIDTVFPLLIVFPVHHSIDELVDSIATLFSDPNITFHKTCNGTVGFCIPIPTCP
jgi:hypothetical protein